MGSSAVAATSVTTVIDAHGNVVVVHSSAITVDQLQAILQQHGGSYNAPGPGAIATPVKPSPPSPGEAPGGSGAGSVSHGHQMSISKTPSSKGKTTTKPTPGEIDRARSEYRDFLDGVSQLGAERDRVAGLIVEFGISLVERAVQYAYSLEDRGERIKDPTGFIVSMVLSWKRISS